MIDRWKVWKDKKVYLVLKNGNQFNGTIISVDDEGNGIIFITMKDKFDKLVTFTSGEIEMIQEKEDGR